MDGWKWDGYRLSLSGTSHVALFAFLERHPKIKHVDLYMDSDYAGLKNARKIKDMLRADPRFKHIRVGIHPAPSGQGLQRIAANQNTRNVTVCQNAALKNRRLFQFKEDHAQ